MTLLEQERSAVDKHETYTVPTLDELERRDMLVRDVAPEITLEHTGKENGVYTLISHAEGYIGSFKARGAYLDMLDKLQQGGNKVFDLKRWQP